jgi:carboxynorspermidine decarboxylase
LARVLTVADHVVFNSFGQLRRFLPLVQEKNPAVALGIRINPEHSEGAVPIYDPCVPSSRLGVRKSHFEPESLHHISGLHFHTLCEQNADALDRTLAVVESQFGSYLKGLDWLNMGGGHHITRADYDVDRLCRCIDRVRERYGVQVYLEPGEAVALDAGLLVATVLDVVMADMPVAILDTSATCHMPDVIEMPYRPEIIGAAPPGDKPWTCRLGGKSCLAGDVIGEYAFDAPLTPGDRLAFLDMAIYSMVKTNTFNGVPLPAIARYRSDTGAVAVVKEFGYGDFKGRLS